jgi:tRNA G46 methylase TrmB
VSYLQNLRTFKSDKVPNPDFRWLGDTERFVNANSLDLEIGGGTGDFAIQYAKDNPHRLLVSIEHTTNKFMVFQKKLTVDHPENLLAAHTNAVSWLTHKLGERKIDRCFFWYPNPEPKNPNKRWIRSPFFGHLLRHLSEEGEIFFASNLVEYIDEVEKFARESWKMHIASKSIVSVPARTAFERKYMATGQTCFEIRLRPTISLN